MTGSRTLVLGSLIALSVAIPVFADACLAADAPVSEAVSNFAWHDKYYAQVNGGFAGFPGSFAGLAFSTRNLLHLGETLTLSATYGVRLHKVQFGLDGPTFFGKRIETGFTIYRQRFGYNQARESSILAFSRDISSFDQFDPSNVLNYVSYQTGGTAFAKFRIRSAAHIGVTYGYEISNLKPQTFATSEYFGDLAFQDLAEQGAFRHLRTSQLTLSFAYNTLDDAANATRGTAFSAGTAGAGPGGNVRKIEPFVEAKHFRQGFRPGHVVGMHLRGSFLRGYAGRQAPPFDRYYLGGEDEVRGFESGSAGPIAFLPSQAAILVLDSNGTPRMTPVIVNGIVTETAQTMLIPVYRPISVGGDTKVVANVEYRIPLNRRLTVALFADAGVSRIALRGQIRPNDVVLETLTAFYPNASFSVLPRIQQETQRIRMSTGGELQIRVPGLNIPVRFYGAFNPSIYRGTLLAQLLIDRSMFQNSATYQEGINAASTPTPFRDRRFLFRFAIGRTF